jgi:hypothetical protein
VRALFSLLVAIQLACGSATMIRYRLPLAGNPGAAACFADCSTLRSTKDDDMFLRCLSTCPNLEVTTNARCDLVAPVDRPPMATCVTARAPKLGSAREAVGAIILGMAAFLLGFVYIDNRRS